LLVAITDRMEAFLLELRRDRRSGALPPALCRSEPWNAATDETSDSSFTAGTEGATEPPLESKELALPQGILALGRGSRCHHDLP